MSKPWVWAASPASGAPTRPSSAERRPAGRSTLAFLDPPYGEGLAGPALASLVAGDWLKPGALVVVEEAAKAEIAAPPALEPIDARVYGDTQIAIFAMPGGG